jgi:hypothetical protein
MSSIRRRSATPAASDSMVTAVTVMKAWSSNSDTVGSY